MESEAPYPYQACYCSICRKTTGGGGYAINLGGSYVTLQIEGEENLRVYNAKLFDVGEPGETETSPGSVTSAGSAGAFSGSTTRDGRNSFIPSPRRLTHRSRSLRNASA
jgi:hypothetical protein